MDRYLKTSANTTTVRLVRSAIMNPGVVRRIERFEFSLDLQKFLILLIFNLYI
jgi:hypothetical protein